MNNLSKFEKYVLDNHKDDLHEIAEHGCSAGFSGLISYYETFKLYSQFADDLHEMLAEYLEDSGDNMPKSLIESPKDASIFQNWIVWFGVEEIAHRFVNDDSSYPD